MWCTTRKPKGSSYTRSLTKLFEHSYRSFNKQYIVRFFFFVQLTQSVNKHPTSSKNLEEVYSINFTNSINNHTNLGYLDTK